MIEALFLAPALAATLGAIAIRLLQRAAPALPADVPNRRSLHARPVPRAGGYGVWLGFLPAAMLFPPDFPGGWHGWLPAFTALAAVSALDDAREVRVVPRLAVHAGAALWAAAWLIMDGTKGGTGVLCTLGLALALAWSANLYNFMDGTAGRAASPGAIGFAAYGLASLAPDAAAGAAGTMDAASAPAYFALAAALMPFLAVNRPRASMFLGDVGAVPLGVLAAAFGAAGVVRGAWPAWFPLLVFLPFIADATLTLVRRALRRERLWEGHRDHFYQRLAQLGAGHGGTLAAYAAATAGTAACALACRMWAPAAGWWVLAAWIAVLLMMFATIDYHWRKKTGAC